MQSGLAGRICLVTGGSSGIGRAAALLLASEGATVAVAARTLEALDGGTGGSVLAFAADLAEPGAAQKLAEAVLRRTGRIDILVNNAGGSRPMARFDDAAMWQESFQLNFHAPRQLAEALVGPMRERRFGRIVNITGAIAAKRFNAAAPAKAALESWSKAAAGVFAADGVTVNCIAPGRLNTRQILNTLHPTEESRRAFIDANIPAGRFGEPEDAAALIAFLASDRAAYINGATIPVDGGAMRLAF